MFYDCAYGCEVKILALTLKFGFLSVYFDIGELVTINFKKALGWKLYLNTYMHAAKLEL